MMSMFKEPSDALGGESPAEREYQIVVRKFSLNFTVSNSHLFLERIDVSNFSFDEVHSPVQHRVPQVKGNVFRLTFAEDQSHQRRIENKIPTARYERKLISIAKPPAKPLGRYDATKSTSEDKNPCHLYCPSDFSDN